MAGHYLHSPSIGGGRVAWVDCAFPGEGPFCGTPDDDIYTATIADSTSHLVTNESTAFVDTPFVDPGGDRIYWVDQRDGGQDVYGESVSGSMPPADLVAPGPPGGFVATTAADGVRLAWQNPSAPDFFRVRILRKSGTSPPSSLDDTSASVVYEGPGTDLGSGPPGPGDFTSFTDTDVAQGTRYSYAIVAFDLQPNYSTAATATSP